MSGYTHCPCCGYDTISSDMAEPELCSECEEKGCEVDGSDPMCCIDGPELTAHDDCLPGDLYAGIHRNTEESQSSDND